MTLDELAEEVRLLIEQIKRLLAEGSHNCDDRRSAI
jgi:hypothetical protein